MPLYFREEVPPDKSPRQTRPKACAASNSTGTALEGLPDPHSVRLLHALPTMEMNFMWPAETAGIP
jgi:hypothetical protein